MGGGGVSNKIQLTRLKINARTYNYNIGTRITLQCNAVLIIKLYNTNYFYFFG